jgi:low density lipoprotein-related protein 2
MDGTDRHTIVSDKLLQPQALTVDTLKKRIFWIDLKYDHLETCDYYGARRFIIASGSVNLPHSISIDIFENTILYADTTKLAIMKLRRHTVTSPSNITYHYKLGGNNALPRHVRVFHSTKQFSSRQSPCGLNNGGCEHFCLLSHGTGGFRCKCKIGFELRRDLRTCGRATASLYFSQANSIRGISLSPTMITETRLPVITPKIGGARAIEVDCGNNVTFFYDPVRRAIFQNRFSGQETPEDSVSEALSRFFSV